LPPADANISRHLSIMAARQPHTPALKIPRGRTRAGDIDYLALNFAELAAEAAAWRERLAARGVRRGDRALVMVRPGLPLIASAFALFQLGAAPVIIDPGMGLKNFLTCVARSRPRALVGIPMAQILSRVFWRKFSTVAVRVPVSGSLTARLTQPKSKIQNPEFASAPSAATDLAAVLFTSGSTGAPKGVCYEHGMFDAQVRLIGDTYAIAPGEVDLPLLPIFALFNPALGMTTIVPELDPRRPAELDPAKIVQAIRQENVTNSFGSPTLWKKIGDHCLAQKITLPTLRRVLCAGAPVPAALWQNSSAFLPNGQLHSPYGATEALPICTVSSDEILGLCNVQPSTSNVQRSPAGSASSAARPAPSTSLPGTAPLVFERSMLNVERCAAPFGACVGHPVAEISVKIIALTDASLTTFADTRELAQGEIGEIIVSGPVVTKEYDALPAATAAAKIADGSAVWHRMGDCGYLDAAGRLWFVGRKAERVETPSGTLHTEPCEQVFRAHPRAARCALIGLGQRPALVVETAVQNSREGRALARELRQLALAHPHTAPIATFYFRPKFPVDVRHNAKIHRLTLAHWAATAKGFASDPKR
jgi:acyl-CoA synthetase (AMP-forming)/AMP-acid ligase II